MSAGGAARLSMQELLDIARRASFVGRRDELDAFRANFDVPVSDPRHRFIFHIHGNAGVGKTSLVRELTQAARGRDALTAVLDESVNSVPEAMEGLCAQFAQQGHPLKALDKAQATYRQRRYEAESAAAAAAAGPGPQQEAGPTAGSTTSSTAGPTAGSLAVAQAGLFGLGLVPGVGAIAGAVDPAQVARGATTVKALLSAHFGKQEDVQLVLDPIGALTPVLVSELNRVAAHVPWIALFFDTYERTGPFLDFWLRDLITSRRHGLLPPQVVVTLSGQRPLDPNCWADYAGFVTDLPLSPFTESEARQFLASKGVQDEEVVREVLKLSGRLPVLVSTLAENPGAVDDPCATAVERFLKWEQDPVRRSAALDGALPRRLNEDVFRAAVEGDGEGLFGWLCALPFVSNRGGRAQYHDVVRDPMLRLRRNSSPERWRAGHNRLAQAFAGWRAEAGEGLDEEHRWGQDAWRELRAEETYHLLCARPRTGLPEVLRDGVDACDAGMGAARHWARAVADAGADGDIELLRTLGRDALAALEDEQRRCTTVLELILARGELAHEARVRALVVRGRDHRNLGEYEQALRDYHRALTLDADCTRAHYGLGETHRLTGRFEESLAEFGRALELDPADIWSRSSGAQTKHLLGRSEEALADLDQVIEARPGHVWSLMRRSQVRRALGDVDGALADIGRAEQLDPDNPWIVGERGEILRHDGRLEEAVAEFDRAFALDPAYAWALGSRAMAKQALGRTDEALADLDEALELKPAYVWALIRRAEIHRERGDKVREFADLDRLVEHAEPKAWALVNRGFAHQQAERYEAALADYGRALAHDPEYSHALASRGGVHERLGRHEEALADLDRALELDPESAVALTVRAGVRRALGDLDGELSDLDAAVACGSDTAVHLTLRGEAHRRAGRYEEAIADYDRADDLRPDDGWIIGSRGQALRSLGRFEEALADLARAGELQPDKAWIAAERGAAMQDLGRHEEALAELDRAIAVDPGYGWAYGRRASVRLAMGRAAQARADLDRYGELGEDLGELDAEVRGLAGGGED
ncbi:tetratricopeptide repeat protein [Streptomyces sp. NBC_00879]|uniref:tetratricopeptide repeat protein n=1 Tax=Streptomyces sp. NBC_00879 TaxID=2975855 RepID=UPI00386E1EE4